MTHNTDPVDILGAAYEKMYEAAAEKFHNLKDKTDVSFHRLVDEVRDRVVELEELTEQEAETVANWLKRDIDDAAQYLSETGHELKDWLGFETALLESGILELLLRAADPATLALLKLKESSQHPYIYHTGEITGPGTLVCDKCGEKLHFYKAGKIPPCPKCHGSSYHRDYSLDQEI